MSTRGAPSWTCPWCERVVPGRESRCHCGCDRAVAEARDKAAGEARSGGGAVLVIALVAVCGFALYAVARQRSKRIEAAALAESERLRASATPMARASGPALADGDLRERPPGYTPPAGWSPPRPRVEPLPAPLPSAKAADAASPPALSTMEEEWEKALALLDPRLEKIAMDTGSLQSSFYPFAARCLAPEAGGDTGTDGAWLSSLKNAPLLGGIQITETVPSVDCASARAVLRARASQVKSALRASEELARTSRVLPGHWRKLVATHQLEIWERY
jgi:hypothetical protein